MTRTIWIFLEFMYWKYDIVVNFGFGLKLLKIVYMTNMSNVVNIIPFSIAYKFVYIKER